MKSYKWEIDKCYIDVYRDECLSRIKKLKSNSIDSIVTDPPYEIGFMYSNKLQWDKNSHAHNIELWKECLRVLKPGGFLVAFAATRTYHRLATAIEASGFLIKDQLAWISGQGFPKSQNISKKIDKLKGAKRQKIRIKPPTNPPNLVGGTNKGGGRPWQRKALQQGYHEIDSNEPITKEAKQWQGFGTHIKPSWEPIVLAQKKLSEKTIIDNILKWGTGAINIDGCRIPINKDEKEKLNSMTGFGKESYVRGKTKGTFMQGTPIAQQYNADKGRWPANICHDGSDEVVSLFPFQKSGAVKTTMKRKAPNKVYGKNLSKVGNSITLQDKKANEGSAARFFYCAKATRRDRLMSKHPTVKPIKLMRWLTRLVTPPNGLLLDIFAGTGTTGFAAMLEGFDCILIEREKEYVKDIIHRFVQYEKESYAVAA